MVHWIFMLGFVVLLAVCFFLPATFGFGALLLAMFSLGQFVGLLLHDWLYSR